MRRSLIRTPVQGTKYIDRDSYELLAAFNLDCHWLSSVLLCLQEQDLLLHLSPNLRIQFHDSRWEKLYDTRKIIWSGLQLIWKCMWILMLMGYSKIASNLGTQLLSGFQSLLKRLDMMLLLHESLSHLMNYRLQSIKHFKNWIMEWSIFFSKIACHPSGCCKDRLSRVRHRYCNLECRWHTQILNRVKMQGYYIRASGRKSGLPETSP